VSKLACDWGELIDTLCKVIRVVAIVYKGFWARDVFETLMIMLNYGQ